MSYCYFRHPRTTGEKRQYYASIENEPNVRIHIRGRRRPKNMPSAWDDNYPSSQRCWKSKRRTQWKAT